jgi:hypothetical protein
MSGNQKKTRSVTKEAAEKAAQEEAKKSWDQRIEEKLKELQGIIPAFKGRNMCAACQRDTSDDHEANTVCIKAPWQETEAETWKKDYHQQLVVTLTKMNNETIMADMAEMKEKRKAAQSASEKFETNLNEATKKISLMESYVDECKGDKKLAEEQVQKLITQYGENMDELSQLREQVASWRRGSEVEVRQRRGSSTDSEVFRVKRERDAPTLMQTHPEGPGQVRYRRASTTGQLQGNCDLTGQGISKDALLKVLPRMTIRIKEEKDVSKFMRECENLKLEASIICSNLNNQNLIEIFYFRAEGMIKIAASAIIHRGFSFDQFTQQILDQVFLGGSAGFRNKFLTLQQEKFETLPQYLARFRNHCQYLDFEPQEWSQIFIEGIRNSEGKTKLKGQNYRRMNLEDICVYLDTQREVSSGESNRSPTGVKPTNIDRLREKEKWATLRPSRNNPARRESKKVMNTNELLNKKGDEDQEKEQRELEDFPTLESRRETLELDADQCAYCRGKDHQAKDCGDEDGSCRFCDGPHPLLFCRRYWKQKAADERETDSGL